MSRMSSKRPAQTMLPSPTITPLKKPRHRFQKCIAWDVDQVLYQWLDALTKWVNRCYNPKDPLHVSDFNTYKFNGPIREHLQSLLRARNVNFVKDFQESDDFCALDQAPFEGLTDLIEQLHDEGWVHYAVTSRPATAEKRTKQWLDKFFPGMFSKIIHLGNFEKQKNATTQKWEVMEELGVSILVDDAVDHAKKALDNIPDSRVFLVNWQGKFYTHNASIDTFREVVSDKRCKVVFTPDQLREHLERLAQD